MAARRNKSQAKRTTSNGTPGWVWLIAGFVLCAAAFLIVPGLMKKDGDHFLRPKPNPDARPAVADSNDEAPSAPASSEPAASAPAPASAPTPVSTSATKPTASTGSATKPPAEKPTQYDFYTLLPGREVQMSDAELAASARAEQQRKAHEAALAQAKAAKDAAANPAAAKPAATTTTPAASSPAASVAANPATSSPAANPNPAPVARQQQPTPLDEMTKTPSATPTQTTVAAAAASNAVASAAGDVSYILQAGSFSGSSDAEAVKAKIAMLGLNARVESGASGSKTVYRVRMGPYRTASELAQAKQKLASGGLPAMPIKAR